VPRADHPVGVLKVEVELELAAIAKIATSPVTVLVGGIFAVWVNLYLHLFQIFGK